MTILWDLTLDGTSIGDRIDKLAVVYSESSVHNTIEMTSIDRSLFFLADPNVSKGNHRLTFYIGSRALHFLLEDRSGGEVDFSLWGRSVSARDESTYRSNIDYILDEPRMASDVVADMVTVSTLDWNIMDWQIPKDYSFSGNPMSGAQQIVKAVGGIMRCKDDGTIDVRYKWNVRPKDITSASTVAEYDRVDTVSTLDAKDKFGTGENIVTITGHTPDLPSPLLELEESSPIVGQDVNIRVFWGNAVPPAVLDQYVTDGSIQDLGEFDAEYEDTVNFIEGVATLPRPIHQHNSTSWMGDSAAPVTYTLGESELFSDELWGVATINYRSDYRKYRLHGHNEERLVMALTLEGISDISVTVRLSVGEEDIASPISDNLLTTSDAARRRGMSFLDDVYYDFRQAQIAAPYHEDVGDGKVISIADSDASVVGRYYVQSVTLDISGPAVLNTIQGVQPK